MEDQILDCVQCDESFLYTMAEQQKCLDMGFDPPKRCPHCRKNRSKFDMSEGHQRASGQKRRLKRSWDRWEAADENSSGAVVSHQNIPEQRVLNLNVLTDHPFQGPDTIFQHQLDMLRGIFMKRRILPTTGSSLPTL